jgi:tetratricopeptide (TPR) repeat protein
VSLLAKRALARGDRLRIAGELERASLAYGDAGRRSRRSAERGSERGASVFALACVGLARIHLAEGEPELASKELGAAGAVAPSEAAEIMYWQACARGWAEDFAQADQILTVVLTLDPAAIRARLQRAGARFKAGDLQGALEDYGQLARENALDESGLVAHAAVLAHLERWAEAELALAPLVTSGAPHAERLLGAVLEKQRRLPEAAAVYARATTAPHIDAALLARLGIVYHLLKRLDEAIALLIDARDAGADDASLYHLGEAAFAARRFKIAVEAWTELAQRNPHRARLTLLANRASQAQADELVAAGRDEEAIFVLEGCIDAKAAYGELAQPLGALHVNASATAIARGRIAMAIAHLRRAAELVPDEPRVWMHLGLLEALGGRAGRALDHVERGLQLAPGDPALRRALVLCAGAAGEPDRARHEIDGCLGGGDAAPGIAPTVAALLAQEARWSDAADVLLAAGQGGGSSAAIAECLLRAGRLDELDRLDGHDVMVWKLLADLRRRRALAARHVLSAWVGDSPAWRPVVRLAALHSAARDDWEDAAALLGEELSRSDRATRTARLDATVLVLGGERDRALRVLLAACRDDPADTRAAHALAVSWFHALSHDAKLVRDDNAWQHGIGAWVRLMRSDSFWESWRMRAQARYGAEDVSLAVAPVRDQAEERFELLVARADHARDDGRRTLSWWLARERSAADELAETGGLRLPGADDALVCGPLLLGQLGLTAALAECVGTDDDRGEIDDALSMLLVTLGIEDADTPVTSRRRSGDKRRLARAFSAVGVTQALIDLGRAEEALQALDGLRCARCESATLNLRRASASPETRLAVCNVDCPDFDERNPGYAAFPDKHERLLRDAHDLAIDVHLELGRNAIAVTPLDAGMARSHFREALSLGAACGELDGSERRVTEIVLGRARALEKRDTLDDAIALIQAMLRIGGDGVDQALHGRIAELLTHRGVGHGNADPPRWSASIVDLEEAVRHNPHAPRSWANLVAAKRGAAASHANGGDWAAAAGLIAGASETLEHATELIPNHPALEQQRQGLQGEMLMIAMLHARDV